MLKVGDKVSLLDEVGDCVVKEILTQNSCLVEDEFGFDRTVSFKDLVKIEPEKFENIQVDHFSTEKREKKFSSKKQTKHIPRVDLHMENLVSSHKYMENHEIVTFQLNHFKNKLDGYIKNGVKEFVVVHGIGTGRLKKEVRHILNSYSNLEYMDDHYNSYGIGATRVFIY